MILIYLNTKLEKIVKHKWNSPILFIHYSMHTYLPLSENICLKLKRDATWIFSRPWIMVAFQIQKSRILDATKHTVFKSNIVFMSWVLLDTFVNVRSNFSKPFVYSSEFLQECHCSRRIWCNCLTKYWQWLVIYQESVFFWNISTFYHFSFKGKVKMLD